MQTLNKISEENNVQNTLSALVQNNYIHEGKPPYELNTLSLLGSRANCLQLATCSVLILLMTIKIHILVATITGTVHIYLP